MFNSAGVGRTGTYIAVDTIRQLIIQSQNHLPTMELDVMGIVYQLRQDRGKMVQTKVNFKENMLDFENFLLNRNNMY